MCNPDHCPLPPNAPEGWLRLRNFVRALRFSTRWTIIEFLGEQTRTTSEIFTYVIESGEKLTKQGLYYHISELKKADIVEVAGYREEGGGAPEKIWKLKTKRIVFDLLEMDGEENK